MYNSEAQTVQLAALKFDPLHNHYVHDDQLCKGTTATTTGTSTLTTTGTSTLTTTETTFTTPTIPTKRPTTAPSEFVLDPGFACGQDSEVGGITSTEVVTPVGESRAVAKESCEAHAKFLNKALVACANDVTLFADDLGQIVRCRFRNGVGVILVSGGLKRRYCDAFTAVITKAVAVALGDVYQSKFRGNLQSLAQEFQVSCGVEDSKAMVLKGNCAAGIEFLDLLVREVQGEAFQDIILGSGVCEVPPAPTTSPSMAPTTSAPTNFPSSSPTTLPPTEAPTILLLSCCPKRLPLKPECPKHGMEAKWIFY